MCAQDEDKYYNSEIFEDVFVNYMSTDTCF